MTNEKAHDILEDFQREMTTHRNAYSNDFIEAHGNAILALEKQIAKKPAQKTNKRYKIPINICPSCGGEISTIEIDYEYCPECGQKIDQGDI